MPNFDPTVARHEAMVEIISGSTGSIVAAINELTHVMVAIADTLMTISDTMEAHGKPALAVGQQAHFAAHPLDEQDQFSGFHPSSSAHALTPEGVPVDAPPPANLPHDEPIPVVEPVPIVEQHHADEVTNALEPATT
jgi:hypothetical protein